MQHLTRTLPLAFRPGRSRSTPEGELRCQTSRHCFVAPCSGRPRSRVAKRSWVPSAESTARGNSLAESAEDDPVLQRKTLSKLSLVLFCTICGSQAAGYLPSTPASILMSSAICFYCWTKESLSTSGLTSAWFVFATTHLCSVVVSCQLLAFFISSSRWTEYKAKTKDTYMAGSKKSGRRNWVQVLCNGGWPTLFSVLFAQSVAFQHSGITTMGMPVWSVFFFGCCLGSYACCCGDTWASEIGVLSKQEPRLITTLETVPRGTNGGVSLLGLGASTFGGLLIGAITFVMSLLLTKQPGNSQVVLQQLPWIPLGLLAGFLGSVVDSVMGATLQYSGFDRIQKKVVNRPGYDSSVVKITGTDILSNNQVNLFSSLITALFIGGLSTLFF